MIPLQYGKVLLAKAVLFWDVCDQRTLIDTSIEGVDESDCFSLCHYQSERLSADLILSAFQTQTLLVIETVSSNSKLIPASSGITTPTTMLVGKEHSQCRCHGFKIFGYSLEKNRDSYKRFTTSPVTAVKKNSGYLPTNLQNINFFLFQAAFNWHWYGLWKGPDYVILWWALIPVPTIANFECHKARNSAKYSLRRPLNGTDRKGWFQNYALRHCNSRLTTLSSDCRTKMSRTATQPLYHAKYKYKSTTSEPRIQNARSSSVHPATAKE